MKSNLSNLNEIKKKYSVTEHFGFGFPPLPGFGGDVDYDSVDDLVTEAANVIGTYKMVKFCLLVGIVMIVLLVLPLLKDKHMMVYGGANLSLLLIILLKKFIFRPSAPCSEDDIKPDGTCSIEPIKVYDYASVFSVFWRSTVFFHIILVFLFIFAMPFLPKSDTSITDSSSEPTPTLTDTPK